MATLTVVARPGQIKTDDVVITMHAVKEEGHDLTNTVTDHPVEEGINASDHSRPNPDLVNWQATISNTPLSNKQMTQTVKSGQYTFSTSAEKAAGAIGATDGFALGEWKKLRKLRDDGTIVKVVTTVGVYESMTIEKISLPRNARNYDAIQFSISFKQIRIVQNKLTTTKTKAPGKGKKKSAGSQTSKDADSKDEDPLIEMAESMSKSSNKTISGVGNFALGGGSGGQSR